MSFLYPSFLFGMLALSVPVAIHLFNFRRTRRVFFTNVALLKTVQTETKSFRRLKHLLILACRCLAIACLVLAFAQPFIPSKSRLGVSRQGFTSLYLDNSYSMQNEENEKRYLDIATGKLDELLGLFRNASSLQLVTNDFSAQEQTVSTAEALRDRVTTVRFAHTPRTLAEVYRRQKNLLATQNPAGGSQFFWFSDFQKSTVGDLSRLKIDTAQRVFLVPMEARPTRNVYVDSVWLSTPFVRELQNNTLNVRVRNSGTESVRNLPLRLFIDQAQVSTAAVSLPGQGAATAVLNFNVTQKGFRRGRIAFEDYPITFDNEYFFTLQASPAIRVLHLYDQKSGPGYIENVYGNDSLFITRSFSAQNVDVGQLRSADLVVLEGIPTIGGTLQADLQRFVRQGGSVAIFPATAPSAAAWAGFLGGLGINGLQVTAAPGSTPVPPQPLAAPARQSPFFRDIFEQSDRQELLNLPDATPVWQWRAVGERLLSLRNGTPLLTQSRVGTGQVYVFASPLQADYGTLPMHALFVPVMYQIAALSARPQRMAYSFDENTIEMTVNDATPNTVYKLKRGDVELIPVQRLNGNQLLLEMPKSNQLSAGQELESGYYELQKNSTVGPAQTEKLLALNHGNRESAMDYYTPDELRRAFAGQSNVQVFDSIRDGDFVDEIREQNLGTNLWKYFILAALGFLLAEIGVIRFMRG
ncbi:BatA domain-containing protein [Tellurirhabdus rosea]|uniref:BatA domain-containing protein n=1 Tax=Tellurirhabdus rosea TaxID=2674997 RepID=UPI002252A401|nr:BatA domain-containing protein [Tellurirhabdus rosea]